MSNQQSAKANIKDRILEVAGRLFAEKGFAKVSVREICAQAGVNVAAINYYFTNKEALYVEVVKHWQSIAFSSFPFDYAKDDSNPPSERLRSFIKCQLMQTLYLEKSPWFGALMSRESIEPSRAIEELTADSLGPSIQILFSIVKDIMGPNTSDAIVHQCSASILGQCTFYHFIPSAIEKLFGVSKSSQESIDALAEHIYIFSIKAIECGN